jgi:hypothetical protein
MKAFIDFKAGLNSVGNLWNTIEPFPELQLQLLGHKEEILTADSLISLIDFKFSEEG